MDSEPIAADQNRAALGAAQGRSFDLEQVRRPPEGPERFRKNGMDPVFVVLYQPEILENVVGAAS